MDTPLWKPDPISASNSQMARFMSRVATTHGLKIDTYSDFHRWSVNRPEDFWADVWDAAEIIHSASYKAVLENPVMPGAKWFRGARLNFAENLLRYSDERDAIIVSGEGVSTYRISYRELRMKVAALAETLRKLGVQKGDRVAAFIPNIPEAVIGMLAATSLGALWSSCSPDFGRQGALDRFAQIEPKVLICANGYRYQVKEHDCLQRITEIVSNIASVEQVIVVAYLENDLAKRPEGSIDWSDATSQTETELSFEQCDFDHPVYIMYSSGTTGKPKCIVHGAGGTLLQHWKEHALHCDLSRDSVLFYFTTCGWMMWNWLVSALQIGATIVLYEGSPAYPNLDTLWRLIENEEITDFGTSPKFLTTCQKTGMTPKEQFDLAPLKSILSTGAPLTAENFRWVYDAVKKDVRLSSISGGTDILSCFMLGNPMLPVYSEEIQCRGLGMNVQAYSDDGRPLENQVGELVCVTPYPSAPTGFWNDDDGSKYRAAYFEHFPGVWRHGDFVKITERGGVIVYGRSDTTLNPGGVRIGAAEIYNPVEALDEVRDSIVIGQKWNGDVRIVLFVALQDGFTLDDTIRKKIRNAIRASATPRHLPALILQVNDIPHTISGKKVEIAVSRVVEGLEVSNRDALANPESLEQFRNFPELQRNT